MSRMSRTPFEYLSGTCTGFATTPLSLSIWIRVYNNISDSICGVGTLGSTNNQYRLSLGSTNRAQAVEADTVSSNAQTAGAISSNVWHNITGVFAAHNNRTIYVDGGNAVNNTTARTCGATTAAYVMSLDQTSGTPAADYAHFAIWNIALSAQDAADLFSRGPNGVQQANLVEYWPLNGNQSPEPSTLTANSLTVTSSNFTSLDPFGNYFRVPYQRTQFVQL